jgi:hypothetical protein
LSDSTLQTHIFNFLRARAISRYGRDPFLSKYRFPAIVLLEYPDNRKKQRESAIMTRKIVHASKRARISYEGIARKYVARCQRRFVAAAIVI